MNLRINVGHCQVLVVDIQEKLAPHLHEVNAMVRRCVQVLQCAELFAIPITVAQQYTKGLGASVDEIKPFITAPVFEKTSFSCFGSQVLQEHIKHLATNSRHTLVVIGCEAHVCVLQTVIDAVEQGYNVVVVDDAVASRNPQDKALAQIRLTQAGVRYVSTEMLLFEWMQNKDSPHFKTISALIK